LLVYFILYFCIFEKKNIFPKNPEAKARQVIDQKLDEAGWKLQDKKDIDLFARKKIND